MSKTILVATGPRGRVERLLRGEPRDDDLRELFFGVRETATGGGIASEIGNFLAHPNPRTQGFVWREVHDLFVFAKVREQMDWNVIVTRDLPAAILEAMRGNLRRARKELLVKRTGKNRAQAEKLLARVLSRMAPTGPGRVSRPAFHSQDELNVFNFVLTNLKVQPLFDDEQLYKDFCRALEEQRLLRVDEEDVLRPMKPAITLFALTAMHNRKIALGGGDHAELMIAPDPVDRLAIYAFAVVIKNFLGGGDKSWASWIVKTALPIADFCEPGTAAVARSAFVGDFEVSVEGKLRRVS